MDKIHIRRFDTEDQDAVWQLHLEGLVQTGSFVDDRRIDQDLLNIKEAYLNNNGEFLIALLDNLIIGMGALYRINNQTAEIKRMRIDKDHQRQGFGEFLLNTLIETAKELGYERLILDTTENQRAARRLYEKRGFREFKRVKTDHLESVFYELYLT